MQTIDMATIELRALNAALQPQSQQTNETAWQVMNPRGAHALAVGLDAPIEVPIHGPTGFIAAG